jgi:hypothetical protein
VYQTLSVSIQIWLRHPLIKQNTNNTNMTIKPMVIRICSLSLLLSVVVLLVAFVFEMLHRIAKLLFDRMVVVQLYAGSMEPCTNYTVIHCDKCFR